MSKAGQRDQKTLALSFALPDDATRVAPEKCFMQKSPVFFGLVHEEVLAQKAGIFGMYRSFDAVRTSRVNSLDGVTNRYPVYITYRMKIIVIKMFRTKTRSLRTDS